MTSEKAAALDGMPLWYPDLLAAVAGHVDVGRRRAVAAANAEMIIAYWRIGQEILDRQGSEGWGTKVADRLARDLRAAFPDAQGYSARNLRYMRTFAAAWPDLAIVQRSVALLPWRHQIALCQKVDNSEQRLWYAQAAIENGWSRDVLVFQIEGRFHERSGGAVTNFSATLPPADSDLAQQATRDPYLFDFLGSADRIRERDLQRGLVEHVEKFLLELGEGFAYVGQNVKLEIGGQDFYLDLLFYHLKLRRYIVVELKVGDFSPSFLGQLGMYMAAVDDLMAHADDAPTIGLVLCKSKNNVVAEYALRGYRAPIGIAEWTDGIAAALPEELASSLPTIAQLEAELSGE